MYNYGTKISRFWCNEGFAYIVLCMNSLGLFTVERVIQFSYPFNILATAAISARVLISANCEAGFCDVAICLIETNIFNYTLK